MSQWEQSISKCPVSIMKLLRDVHRLHCCLLAWCLIALFFFFQLSNLTKVGRKHNPPASSLSFSHVLVSYINLYSFPLKATSCSPDLHGSQAVPKTSTVKHILPNNKRHLRTEQLDFKGAACTLRMIENAASIIHLRLLVH